MSSVLSFGFYQGTRSEYLATYLLSRLCIVNPVRREGDFGIDMLCHLASQHGKLLAIGDPFSVQVKSEGESADEVVIEDKSTPDDAISSIAVRWILERTIPMFIVVVSKKEQRICVYSTAKLSSIHPSEKHPVHSIVLVPGGTQGRREELVYDRATKTETVYLGKPVIDTIASELEKNNERASLLTHVLRDWVLLDLANILNRKAEVWYVRHYNNYEPNQRPVDRGGSAIWTVGYPVDSMIETLATVLTSVGYNIAENVETLTNDYIKASKLVGALELCEDAGKLDDMGIELLYRIRSSQADAWRSGGNNDGPA